MQCANVRCNRFTYSFADEYSHSYPDGTADVRAFSYTDRYAYSYADCTAVGCTYSYTDSTANGTADGYAYSCTNICANREPNSSNQRAHPFAVCCTINITLCDAIGNPYRCPICLTNTDSNFTDRCTNIVADREPDKHAYDDADRNANCPHCVAHPESNNRGGCRDLHKER